MTGPRIEAAARALHEKSWELWKPERKGPAYDDDEEYNKEYFRVRARIALDAADAITTQLVFARAASDEIGPPTTTTENDDGTYTHTWTTTKEEK